MATIVPVSNASSSSSSSVVVSSAPERVAGITVPAKPKIVISIDIETGGCRYFDSILSIGTARFCDGKCVEKKRFSMEEQKDVKMEERCVKQFWSRFPELLETLRKEARPIVTVMTEFKKYIDDNDETADVLLVGDNIQFDFPHISYYYQKYLGCLPIDYKKDGTYRDIAETQSMLMATDLTQDQWHFRQWRAVQNLKLDVGRAKHTHFPDDDAEHIGTVFCRLYEKLRPRDVA